MRKLIIHAPSSDAGHGGGSSTAVWPAAPALSVRGVPASRLGWGVSINGEFVFLNAGQVACIAAISSGVGSEQGVREAYGFGREYAQLMLQSLLKLGVIAQKPGQEQADGPAGGQPSYALTEGIGTSVRESLAVSSLFRECRESIGK